ncbi:MAG: cob(I)yrinic acid a,c-diamide adenosyltransferase [Deltaproteobacteria bacterium]|nr:cob(I)yrinic acid a,c-diamide adenosyltransferase [Deltaproteobacteria bacterium]
MRITKVYTRTGDGGDTGLGTGRRVPKDSLRIAAYGTVDELNSVIGLAIALDVAGDLKKPLARIQHELFNLGSDLCIPEEDKAAWAADPAKKDWKIPRIESRHVDALEELMDRLSEGLKPLENFILPGGTAAASQLHVARCVCRRAEREAISLSRVERIGPFVVKYLNRLSDALFVLARYENSRKGTGDVLWDESV